MGRLYDAFVEVGPRFTGFGDIKSQGDKAGQAYGKALADAAVKAAKANARNLGAALAKARQAEADAAGKVRVAETQLAESRKKYGAASSQAVAAEEKLAAAQRKSAASADTTKHATEALGKAQSQVANAAADAGKRSGGRFSGAFKGALTKIGGEKEGRQVATRFGVGMNGAIGSVVSRSAGIFVAGFAAIKSAQVFGSFINDARESAKVGRLTAQVILSTGGAAKITAGQVGDLATAISNKTGADDEAIQSGQNLLLTFTNIKNGVGKGNDIFNQASQAITDMTAAMNGGEVTAEGMKTSSIQLGKALNDPIKGVTALSKVGVSFTAQQKEQIKTLVGSGKTMEAQKIILNELGKEFGGAAAAAADPLTKLKTIAGNLSEQLGGFLLPIVDKFATFLGTTVIPFVSKLADQFAQKLAPKMKEFGQFIDAKVLPALKKFGDFISDKILPLIPEIVGVFTGLGSKIVNAIGKIDLAGIADDIWTGASQWAGKLIGGLKSGIDKGDWKPLGSAIGDGLAAALKAIGEVSGKILDGIGALIDKVDWGKLGGKVSGAITGMLKSVDWKALGSALGDAVVTIFQKTGDLSVKIGDSLKALMKSIDWKSIGRDATDSIGQFVSGVDWGKVFKTLGLTLIKSVKLNLNIKNLIMGALVDLTIGVGEAIGGAFKDAGKWLWKAGGDLISGLLGGAGAKAKELGGWFKAHVGDPVVNFFDSLAISAGLALISIGQAVLGLVKVVAPALKFISDMFLGMVGNILGAAAQIDNALGGHLHLQEAADGFNRFREGVSTAFDGAIAKAGDWDKTLDKAKKELVLKANIQDLETKLRTAKEELADPDLTKERRAELTATKVDLEKKIRAAKGLLADPALVKKRVAQLEANKTVLERRIADAKRALANPQLTATKRAVLTADKTKLEAKLKAAQAQINALKGKTVLVRYSAAGVTTWTAASTRGGGKQGGIGMRTGGAVHGPGGPTDDRVPIMASAGEHMWTAREVAAAGGHRAVEQMRKSVVGLAAGGPVINMRKQGVFPSVKAGQKYIDGLFGGVDGGPPGSRQRFRGQTLNARTIRMLLNAERILGAMFHITQGSYSTRVAASGGTHSGGGAMDTNGPRGWNTAVAALRKAGFAAWHRTPAQGPWNHHIHSIALGDTSASPSAKAQMASFRRGGDGLGHGMAKGGPVLMDKGGYLPVGRSMVDNRTGKPEPLTRTDQLMKIDPASIRELAALLRDALTIDGRSLDTALSRSALGRGYR